MLKEISDDFEKLKQKRKKTTKNINELFNKIDDILNDTEKTIESLPDNELNTKLESFNTKFKSLKIEENYNNYFNSYYSSLSKLGKSISKTFTEIKELKDFYIYDYNKKLFYTIILKELYRRGDFLSANSLIKEAKLNFEEKDKLIFQDLNIITKELRNKKIEPLHNWCEKYKSYLENEKSNLFFETIKLEYLLMINDPNKTNSEIINFAKQNFKKFMNKNETFNEISKLMTLIIFRNNKISKNPYREYDINDLWKKITTLFTNNCCTYLKLPPESCFFLTICAGMISLPQILKAMKILNNKIEIGKDKELPFEIKLPNQFKFHSLFICPVTKEISNKDNPPMLLNCGHCVSKNALEKMEKTGTGRNQIKCPTCPNKQNYKDAKELHIF
jgi:hypothetical protein